MDLRILFLGMPGVFTFPPLAALINAGYLPIALITPPPAGTQKNVKKVTYPIAASQEKKTDNIFQLAASHGLPIYEVGAMHDAASTALLKQLSPDLIIVACFDRLLPKHWLNAPRLGCINMHPSMLPDYRGPRPLEDQLSCGETSTGITLHFMDEGADTGDIIIQQALPISATSTVQDLERQAAEAGARLLLEILNDPENIPRRPQTPA